MDNFIVSARKYRPDNFSTVVGQETITQTLKNAIKNKHIAQAYLFCGPRGVGKTTCARIYAKTINCLNITPDFEACNECESCRSFAQSRSFNIHELDAASNNSVDDIRNLIDQVRIPPQIAKYSIYIIDEVHMLSSAAFNAFLKTLEEPPAHAIFILATTEKHKIIPTILSRCQIFDFNRIKIDDIVNYLEKIARNENVHYEREGLHIIAQKADGGMRDALSIFDQVVNFTEAKVTYQNVIENLNVLDYEYYFRLVDNFRAGNVGEVLLIFNEILDKGFDAHQFLNGLGSHFRDLLVCKNPSTLILLEKGEQVKEKYRKQAEACSTEFIFQALSIVNAFDMSYKTSNNKRLHVELALINLATPAEQKKKPETSTIEEVTIKKENPNSSGNIQNVTEKSAFSKPETGNPTPPKTIKPEVNSAHKVEESQTDYKSSLSIKSALKNVSAAKKELLTDKTENHVLDNTYQKKPFSLNELISQWQLFAESIKHDSPRLSSTLTSSAPETKDENVIIFKVLNKLQLEAIHEKKNDLLAFLREKLQNSAIELQIEVEENTNTQKLIYTDEDKFKRLIEKNPNLGVLKQKLDLDFE